MQPTLYRIQDTLDQTVYLTACPDEITAELELELLAAEYPHIDLEIEPYLSHK